MCSIPVVDQILNMIVERVFKSGERHVGFLLHYKRNLKNLEVEVTNLQDQRSDIEGKVNEANCQGDATDEKVSAWLENVAETKQEVDKLMDEKTAKENMLCFRFNFISRYRLSKKAEKKVVGVKDLTEKGKFEKVSHPREAPLEVVFRLNGNYESFHSRDKVFEDIVQALKDSKVNSIGVYGTGGVGKTSTVTKVGELVKKDGTFYEVVMAVVSQDANVTEIQRQLAARLKDFKLDGETDEVGRATQLWNRLDNGKKNLIILDDVWQELDLKKIGLPITNEKKSCKVVLTSRNRDVWRNLDDHKDFKIGILSEEESWALFKKKVGNCVDADELRGIAWAVCKECQGLPVAINAIGAALRNKDMYAWEDALDKLKNCMPEYIEGIDRQVYASLKWSYDRLDSEEAKSCFLLCSLFPEDAKISIHDLVRYYMTGRIFCHVEKPDSLEKALNRIRTVVATLKSRCLLLDENNSKDLVKMHDVVRDVAVSIAKCEKSFLVKHGVKHWPEKATYEHCSVISLRPNDMREFPCQLLSQELHTLWLDCTNNQLQLQFPGSFFGGAEDLMVLDLKRVTMLPNLPESLAKLAKLQMLCLNGCALGDIAMLKDLKDHLEILSLRRSTIKVLPQEVGELTRLRLLDMDGCDELKVIPKGVISQLIRLEELYMPWTFDQWEGTRAGTAGRDTSCVSVDELMSLTQLTTLLHVHLQDPVLLPKDFTLENMVRFQIAVAKNAYRGLYDEDSIGVLQLENMNLANPLGGLLGKPKSKSFSHLTDLFVEYCRLKYLFSPTCARGLVQLKQLKIRGCMDMEGVIGNEGEKDEDIMITFSRLKYLELESLPNLISFYPKKEMTATSSESSSAHAQAVLFTDKVACPALQLLTIGSVPKITEIWYKQNFLIPEKETESSFNQLCYMKISECDKLMNILGDYPKMEAIVTEKQKGKEIDGYVTRFPELMDLTLSDLPNLESFCRRSIRSEAQPLFDHQVAFPALYELVIESLPNITDVWDKKLRPAESFHLLSKLDVSNCGKLVNLVQSNMLPQLRNQNLEYLIILESLIIKDCPLLRNLLTVSVAKALGGLKELSLMSCSTMEEVIATDGGHEEVIDDQEIVFRKLELLELQDLSNLKSFCSANCNFNLPALQEVVLKGCPNMQTFTSGSVRMPPTPLVTEGNDHGHEIEDLNKHFQLQHSKVEALFDNCGKGKKRKWEGK